MYNFLLLYCTVYAKGKEPGPKPEMHHFAFPEPDPKAASTLGGSGTLHIIDSLFLFS
jgi:hypothetical protein